MNMLTSIVISVVGVSVCYFLVGEGSSLTRAFYIEIATGIAYAMGAAAFLTYFAT